MSTTTIADLPDEILAKILGPCMKTTYKTIPLVCQKWYGITTQFSCRKETRLIFPNEIVRQDHPLMEFLCNSNCIFPNILYKGTNFTAYQMMLESTNLSRCLENLEVRAGTIRDICPTVFRLLETSHNLSSISLDLGMNIDNDNLKANIMLHPNQVWYKLKKISIEAKDCVSANLFANFFTTYSDAIRSLTYIIEVDNMENHEHLFKLINKNENSLKSLTLHRVNDNIIDEMSTCSQLQLDEFEWIGKYTDDPMKLGRFLESMNQLKKLNLTLLQNEHCFLNKLKNLQCLTLTCSTSIQEEDGPLLFELSMLNNFKILKEFSIVIKTKGHVVWSENIDQNVNLEKLTIVSGSHAFHNIIDGDRYYKIVDSFPNLTYLKLDKCGMFGMEELFKQLLKLQTLHLTAHELEPRCNKMVPHIMKNLIHLEELELVNFKSIMTDFSFIDCLIFPNLKNLHLINCGDHITERVMMELLVNCPLLRSIQMRYFFDMPKNSLDCILGHYKHLQSIDIRGAQTSTS